MKQCSKCEHLKSAFDFNLNNKSRDGIAHWCKACKLNWKKHTTAGRAYRRRWKSIWSKRCRHKANCHLIVFRAVKSGKLLRLPCEKCGSVENVEAHHDDYSKPLSIRWLCRKHHKEHHDSVKNTVDKNERKSIGSEVMNT